MNQTQREYKNEQALKSLTLEVEEQERRIEGLHSLLDSDKRATDTRIQEMRQEHWKRFESLDRRMSGLVKKVDIPGPAGSALYQEFYNRFEGYQASVEKRMERLAESLGELSTWLDRWIIDLAEKVGLLELGKTSLSNDEAAELVHLRQVMADLQKHSIVDLVGALKGPKQKEPEPPTTDPEGNEPFWVATMPAGESYVFGPGKRAWLIGFDRGKSERLKNILNLVVKWYRDHPEELITK